MRLMKEVDVHIQDLYKRYKADKAELDRPAAPKAPVTLFERILGRSKKAEAQAAHNRLVIERNVIGARGELEELIASKPGKYPLSELSFGPQVAFDNNGFSFGFAYPLGEDKFPIDYFYTN